MSHHGLCLPIMAVMLNYVGNKRLGVNRNFCCVII